MKSCARNAGSALFPVPALGRYKPAPRWSVSVMAWFRQLTGFTTVEPTSLCCTRWWTYTESMPIHWSGRRQNVKPSTSVFGFAACVAVGMLVGFAESVMASGGFVGQRLLPLILSWVTWNLLPATLFAIGSLLRRAGR